MRLNTPYPNDELGLIKPSTYAILVKMSRTRQSRHSTVFVIALFFSILSQSLLLGPNINTRMFLSIPTNWIAIGGWMICFLFLILFSSFVFELNKLFRLGIFIASATVLVILGYLSYQQGAISNTILAFTLAAGLVFSEFEIPKITTLGFQDRLPLLILLVNAILGIGFLFFPEKLISPPNDGFFENISMILGVLLLGTLAIGIILRKNRKFLNGRFPKVIAIPWLVYTIFIAINETDLGLLILPACLTLSLLTIGSIPWELFRLPPEDKLGHRLFYGISILIILILVLFSTLLNGTGDLFSDWIATKIQIINITVLAINLLLAFSFLLIGSVNIAINLLFNSSIPDEQPPEPTTASNDQATSWENSIKRAVMPLTEVQPDFALKIQSQNEEISNLSQELNKDRHRLTQLTLLNDLEQQLKPILDPPVVAQLTVNTIQKAFNLDLVTVFTYDYPRHEFVSLASAGKSSGIVPPEYRQPMSKGLIGRAARLRKAQYSPDTRLDSDYFELAGAEISLRSRHSIALSGID